MKKRKKRKNELMLLSGSCLENFRAADGMFHHTRSTAGRLTAGRGREREGERERGGGGNNDNKKQLAFFLSGDGMWKKSGPGFLRD